MFSFIEQAIVSENCNSESHIMVLSRVKFLYIHLGYSDIKYFYSNMIGMCELSLRMQSLRYIKNISKFVSQRN